MKKGDPVLVTDTHRGIYFGYLVARLENGNAQGIALIIGALRGMRVFMDWRVAGQGRDQRLGLGSQ
jgi:hypothetical protein